MLLAALTALGGLSGCASSRTVVIETERPGTVHLADGTLVCARAPCQWSFSRSACSGPIRSYSPFVGFEVVEGGLTFQGPMVRFCELEDGEVITVPMSANASVSSATIELIDSPILALVRRATHVARGRVTQMWLLPASQLARGNLAIRVELEEPPLLGTSRRMETTLYAFLRHPGRAARHLPAIRRSTLKVGGDVLVFELGDSGPFRPGQHIENADDRGAELRALLARRAEGEAE